MSNSMSILSNSVTIHTVKKWLLCILALTISSLADITLAAPINKSDVNATMVNQRLPDGVNKLPKGNYLWPYRLTTAGFNVDTFAQILSNRMPATEEAVAEAGVIVEETGTGAATVKKFNWVIDYCVINDTGAFIPSVANTDTLKLEGDPPNTDGIVNNYAFRCTPPTASAPPTGGAPAPIAHHYMPVSMAVTVVMDSAAKVTDVYPTPGLPRGKLYYFEGGWEQKKRFMPVMELPTFVNQTSDSVVTLVSVCQQGGAVVLENRDLADNRYATTVKLKTSLTNKNRQLATKKLTCGSGTDLGDGLYEFEPSLVAGETEERELKVKFEQFTAATRLDTQPKSANDLRLNVFNVGEGNCAILQCPGNDTAVIFDCGTTAYGNQKNFEIVDTRAPINKKKRKYHFEPRFLEILSGVNNVHMIVSHPDGDHYSILLEMLDSSIFFDLQTNGEIDSTKPKFVPGTLGDILKDKLRNVYIGGEFFERGETTKRFMRGMADVQRAQDSADKFNLYLSMDDPLGTVPKAGNDILRGKRVVKKGARILPSKSVAVEYTAFENTHNLHRFGGASQAEMFPLNVVEPGSSALCGGASVEIKAANTPFDSVRAALGDTDFGDKDTYIRSVNNLLRDTRDNTSPSGGTKVATALANNGSSIVTEIGFGGKTILLTADANFEAVAEAMGAAPLGNAQVNYSKNYDLVSAQHHGSDNGYHFHSDDRDELTSLGANQNSNAKAARQNNFRQSAGVQISRLMLQADRVAKYNFPHRASTDPYKANNFTSLETNRTYNQDSKPTEFPTELEHLIDFKDYDNQEFGEAEVFHTGEYGDLVVDISPAVAGGEDNFTMNCVGPFGYGKEFTGLNKVESSRKKWERSRWCRPAP